MEWLRSEMWEEDRVESAAMIMASVEFWSAIVGSCAWMRLQLAVWKKLL